MSTFLENMARVSFAARMGLDDTTGLSVDESEINAAREVLKQIVRPLLREAWIDAWVLRGSTDRSLILHEASAEKSLSLIENMVDEHLKNLIESKP